MYRELAAHRAFWTCQYEALPGHTAGSSSAGSTGAGKGKDHVGTTTQRALKLVVDNHAHALVVSCPVPPDVHAAGTTRDGRYRRRVSLRVWKSEEEETRGNPPYFQYLNTPICTISIAANVNRHGHGQPSVQQEHQESAEPAPTLSAAAAGQRKHKEPVFLSACTMITEHEVSVHFAVATRPRTHNACNRAPHACGWGCVLSVDVAVTL